MKTLIEMAHEVYGEHTFWAEDQLLKLKAFADLVRADEREVRSLRWDEYIAKAIEAEREACAKVADYYSMHDQDTPADIAEAIRNRGNT